MKELRIWRKATSVLACKATTHTSPIAFVLCCDLWQAYDCLSCTSTMGVDRMMPYMNELFTGFGLFLIVLGLPMLAGKVKRNRWYGVRTTKTLSSDAIWYPANKAGGWAIAWTGVTVAAGALIAPLLVQVEAILYVNLGIAALAILVMVVYTLKIASSLE
jgi:uncharacterized membrane protein